MVSRKKSRPEGTPRAFAPAPLSLRPLVRVDRIALFEREVRERLSRSALELLFAAAQTISEGQRSTRAGREMFFGSTMLTIDLKKTAAALRDRVDARTAARLANKLEQDTAALARIRAIATRETERLVGTAPKTVATEIRLRTQGTSVFVDVDVEAGL